MCSAAAGVAAAASIVGTKAASAQSLISPNHLPRCFVEIPDSSFAKYRLFSSTVEQLATGMRWQRSRLSGDGRYLLVSDIPNNRIMI
jgi:gluconolactonase